jgi:hypothetical protein
MEQSSAGLRRDDDDGNVGPREELVGLGADDAGMVSTAVCPDDDRGCLVTPCRGRQAGGWR